MHLGVALLLLVLGRGWRGDDGGINNRAGRDANPLAIQVEVHNVEHLAT
jgi:hypothetical protein